MQLPESSSKQWLEKDDLFESQSHVDIMNRETCEHHTWTAPKPKWEPPRSLSRDPQCWMSPCWESVLARVRCPRLTTRSACCPCPLRAPGVAADHRAPSGWQCHTAPSACTEGAPGQRRLWKGNAGDSETESERWPAAQLPGPHLPSFSWRLCRRHLLWPEGTRMCWQQRL